MLNQLTLVGRLVSDPQINETENGRKDCNITLAVSRSYKNEQGIYETDFIPVTLWVSIAGNTINYFKKGDLVGVRGKLESSITTDDNHTIEENKRLKLRVVAEKVTFLSNKSNKEEE